MLRANRPQTRVRVPHKYCLEILESESWDRQPIRGSASLLFYDVTEVMWRGSPGPVWGRGEWGWRWDPQLVSCLKDQKSMFLVACKGSHLLPGVLFQIQALDGLTNVPLAPLP